MRAATVLVLLLVSVPAAANDAVRISTGYSFAQYLDGGEGNAPLGLYLSIASCARFGADFDLAFHRDTYLLDSPDGPAIIPLGQAAYEGYGDPREHTLGVVTAMIGPRVNGEFGRLQPFGHLLLGMAYSWLSERGRDGDMAVQVGGGVDFETNSALLIRFALDYQVLRDQIHFGQSDERRLRLSAGLAF